MFSIALNQVAADGAHRGYSPMRDGFILAVIAAVTLMIYGPTRDAGGFWWTDESRHVMDGVYFRDLIRD